MTTSLDQRGALVWPLRTFASLITEMRGGAPLKPSDFTKSGVKVVPKGGIGRKGWIEVEDRDLQYCSEEFASAHRTNSVTDEYTLVVLRDLVPSGPSIGLIVRMSDPDCWILAQGVYGFRLNRDADPAFLSQVSNTQWYRRIMNQIMVGSTQVHITNTAFKSIAIPVPEIEEQRAIATALSDVDALIAGLEKLIAKKRDLKQAAMQQLLTGQTRLPGFSGQWSVKRLGDHFSILKNGVNSRAELSVEGGVAYLHYGDIHGSKSLFLNPQSTTMPTLPLAKAKDLDRLQSGDLVFADVSEDLDGVGKSVEVQGSGVLDLVSGQHTIAIRFDKTVLADGFKAYLQFFPAFSAHLYKLAAGTKVYATNRSHIASAEIKLPEVDEQIAIASILHSMDTELSSIENRLEKVCQLKQGMMQELLTGRTRLV